MASILVIFGAVGLLSLACVLAIAAFSLAWSVANTKYKKQLHSVTARYEAALRSHDAVSGAPPGPGAGHYGHGASSSSPGPGAPSGGPAGVGAMYESFTLGWLNLLVQHTWLPVLEKLVSSIAAERLQLVLNEVLRKSSGRRPWKYLESVAVEEVTFGLAPPQFQFCTARYDPARSHLLLTMNMNFHSSGFQAVLRPRLRQTWLLRSLAVRLEVMQLRLAGRLHLGLHLTHEPPGIKGVDYSFAEPPEFDIQASPVGYLNLHGELPGLIQNLRAHLQRIINRRIVEPNRRYLDLQRIYRNKHVQRVGGPGGCLRVGVIGGRNLMRRAPDATSRGAAAAAASLHTPASGAASPSPAASATAAPAAAAADADCDPYVELRFGREVFRTPIAHRTADPVFNWQFDVPLPADLPPPSSAASAASSPAPPQHGASSGASGTASDAGPDRPPALMFRVLNARTLGEPEPLSSGSLALAGLGLEPNGQPRPLLLELATQGQAGGGGAARGTLSLQVSWHKAQPKKASPSSQDTPRAAPASSPTPSDAAAAHAAAAATAHGGSYSSSPSTTPGGVTPAPSFGSHPPTSGQHSRLGSAQQGTEALASAAAAAVVAAAQEAVGSGPLPRGIPSASGGPASGSAADGSPYTGGSAFAQRRTALSPRQPYTTSPGYAFDTSAGATSGATAAARPAGSQPNRHSRQSSIESCASVSPVPRNAFARLGPTNRHQPNHHRAPARHSRSASHGGVSLLTEPTLADFASQVRAPLAPPSPQPQAPGHHHSTPGGAGRHGDVGGLEEELLIVPAPASPPLARRSRRGAGHSPHGAQHGAIGGGTGGRHRRGVSAVLGSWRQLFGGHKRSSSAVAPSSEGHGPRDEVFLGDSFDGSYADVSTRSERRGQSGEERRAGQATAPHSPSAFGSPAAAAAAASAAAASVSGADVVGGGCRDAGNGTPTLPSGGGNSMPPTPTPIAGGTAGAPKSNRTDDTDELGSRSRSSLTTLSEHALGGEPGSGRGLARGGAYSAQGNGHSGPSGSSPTARAESAVGASRVALPNSGARQTGAVSVLGRGLPSATALTDSETPAEAVPADGGHRRNAPIASALGEEEQLRGEGRSEGRGLVPGPAGAVHRSAAAAGASGMSPVRTAAEDSGEYGGAPGPGAPRGPEPRPPIAGQQPRSPQAAATRASPFSSRAQTKSYSSLFGRASQPPDRAAARSGAAGGHAAAGVVPEVHAPPAGLLQGEQAAAAAHAGGHSPAPSARHSPNPSASSLPLYGSHSIGLTNTALPSGAHAGIPGGREAGADLPSGRLPMSAPSQGSGMVTGGGGGSGPAGSGNGNGGQWPAALQSLAQVVKMQRLLEAERARNAELLDALGEVRRKYEAMVRLRRSESHRALVEGARFLLHAARGSGAGGARAGAVRGVLLWYSEARGLVVVEPEGAAGAAAAVEAEAWSFAPKELVRVERGCASFPAQQPSLLAGVVAALTGRTRAPHAAGALDPLKCFSLHLEGGRCLSLQLQPRGNGRSRDEWVDALQDTAARFGLRTSGSVPLEDRRSGTGAGAVAAGAAGGGGGAVAVTAASGR